MRKWRYYYLRRWLIYFKVLTRQLIIPLLVLQGLRTIFFPTTFDVILVIFLALIALAVNFRWV